MGERGTVFMSHLCTSFFYPKNVAVIGAKDTPGSVGRTIMTNLIKGCFPGRVFPVNPKRKECCGLVCFPSVVDLPEKIDLALIVIPAKHVLEAMKTCVQAGVKSVVIISAGFKEQGKEGELLEKAVVDLARSGGVRIIGPNCLGLMNPHHNLNASFASDMPLTGSLAFISQSGALCTAVLDWSLSEKIGFSSFVSIGSMADIEWADLIEYFDSHSKTEAILMYMETVGNPERFLEAAKKAQKPIVVIKPGRTKEAAIAAASHTGALVGSDDVFDAVCESAGILRVNTMAELFDMAEIIVRQPLPKGPRLAIVTNAGGPGVLATDAVIECGAQMTQLAQKTVDQLNLFLPRAWSHGNPVDILGDADPERYEKTVECVFQDDAVDGLLVVLTPQEMTNPTHTAELLKRFAHVYTKPILVSFLGGESVEGARKIFREVGVPCYAYPDEAVWSFSTLWNQSKRVPNREPQFSYESKEHLAGFEKGVLSEFDSKKLVTLYDIPVVETRFAKTCSDAVLEAEKIGYPVVVKVHSNEVTHKVKAGGVLLHICDSTAVQNAFYSIEKNIVEGYGKQAFLGVTVQKMVESEGIEILLGSLYDPQFGPVIVFGAGGRYVEEIRDRALALPFFTRNDARKIMEKTHIWNAIVSTCERETIRKLENVLVNFSRLIMENKKIVECDLNPILLTQNELLCLDARFVVRS